MKYKFKKSDKVTKNQCKQFRASERFLKVVKRKIEKSYISPDFSGKFDGISTVHFEIVLKVFYFFLCTVLKRNNKSFCRLKN